MLPFITNTGGSVFPKIPWEQCRYQSYSSQYYHHPTLSPHFPCTSRDVRDKWLINLTDEVIPDDVLDIACLGKNFGVPIINSRKLPVARIIATIESKMTTVPREEHEYVRQISVDVISNFLQTQTYPVHPQLIDKMYAAHKFKKSRPDILFFKADKGNVTVAVTRDIYLAKMSKHLDDRTTYKVMPVDPTPGIEKKVNRLLTHWHKRSFITEVEKSRLRSSNSNVALSYGQPKIHKEGVPFRMIVSFIGTPTYHLAKYLQRILLECLREEVQSGLTNKTAIINSNMLVKKIRSLNLPQDFAMISMDVVSLFTNVPLPLVICGICRRWEVIRKYTKIPQDEFIRAVTVCFNASAFQFNGTIYQQTFGAAMGSPLSPVLAEIILNDLENYCIDRLDFPIYFYTRYVDDVLVFLPQNRAASTLACFNSYHPRLQFTLETEVDSQINFLEVTLIREKGRVKFDWFRKPTCSGRYLNYYSHHPKSQKIGTIYNLVDRAILLAEPEFHLKNLAFIRQSLIQNGYPVRIVKNIIYRRQEFFLLEKNYMGVYQREHLDDRRDAGNRHITLPYVMGLSETLQRNLLKFRIHLSFRNYNNLGFLFGGHKDLHHRLKVTNTVYSISCRSCRFIFIDHTKESLGAQIGLHYQSLRKPETQTMSNRLTDHAFSYLHDFDFESVQILAVETQFKKRELLTLIFRERELSETHHPIDKISSVSQTYCDLFH